MSYNSGKRRENRVQVGFKSDGKPNYIWKTPNEDLNIKIKELKNLVPESLDYQDGFTKFTIIEDAPINYIHDNSRNYIFSNSIQSRFNELKDFDTKYYNVCKEMGLEEHYSHDIEKNIYTFKSLTMTKSAKQEDDMDRKGVDIYLSNQISIRSKHKIFTTVLPYVKYSFINMDKTIDSVDELLEHYKVLNNSTNIVATEGTPPKSLLDAMKTIGIVDNDYDMSKEYKNLIDNINTINSIYNNSDDLNDRLNKISEDVFNQLVNDVSYRLLDEDFNRARTQSINNAHGFYMDDISNYINNVNSINDKKEKMRQKIQEMNELKYAFWDYINDKRRQNPRGFVDASHIIPDYNSFMIDYSSIKTEYENIDDNIAYDTSYESTRLAMDNGVINGTVLQDNNKYNNVQKGVRPASIVHKDVKDMEKADNVFMKKADIDKYDNYTSSSKLSKMFKKHNISYLTTSSEDNIYHKKLREYYNKARETNSKESWDDYESVYRKVEEISQQKRQGIHTDIQNAYELEVLCKDISSINGIENSFIKNNSNPIVQLDDIDKLFGF